MADFTAAGAVDMFRQGARAEPRRPFKLTAHQNQEGLARRDRGELLTEIARSYNVSANTISGLSG